MNTLVLVWSVCVGMLCMWMPCRVNAESVEEQAWRAVERGDLAELHDAVKNGAQIGVSARPYMVTALSRRDIPMVDALLAHGAGVTRPSVDGGTPLKIAVTYPEIPLTVIERLLASAGPAEDGLLTAAVSAGRDDVALWLLSKGVPVDPREKGALTALMALAQRPVTNEGESVSLARILLKSGADGGRRESGGKSAGDFAAERGYVKLLAVLEPDNTPKRDLVELRQSGLDRQLVFALQLHASSGLRFANPPKNPPTKQLGVIGALLREGADPNANVPGWRGSRPILATALEGIGRPDPEVLGLLLKGGARWSSLGDHAGEALARVAGDVALLRVALANGLEVDIPVSLAGMDAQMRPLATGATLLHAAASAGSADAIEELIAKGAKRDAEDTSGYTALMRAVEGGHEAAVQRLLDLGAKIEGTTQTGLALVDLAAASGNMRRVRHWDTEGKYRELLEQFPPVPKSPWLGDWVVGEGEMQVGFRFDGDGTGRWMQRVFAWRETEDGVNVRMVTPHSKVRGFNQTREISLVCDSQGGLRLATPSSSPEGERMWMLRRPGRPAPDFAARLDEENKRQAAAQVTSRLAAVKSGQSTDVYLDGIGLSALPAELLAEKRWTGVSISWQELKTLPAGVSRWSGVERVSIVNQRGLVIETGALDLPKLTALEIRNARLAALPLKLEAVPSLTELSVSDNRLTRLPSGWGKVPACRSVLAVGNRLRSLPEDLGEAVSLQMLNVSENQLTDLPASLERAPIQTLAVERNGLLQVPAVIGRLHGLTYLSLADNRLSALPASITSLAALEGLDVSSNRLTKFPEMRESAGLKRLLLRGNLIAELPDDPACIPAGVTELDLSGNRLARVPAWVETRGFARLNLRGNLFSEEEARRITRAAEEAWRTLRK